jgi:hypothetical protein
MEHYKGRELDAVGGKESDGRLEFKKTRDQDYQHYSYQPFWLIQWIMLIWPKILFQNYN